MAVEVRLELQFEGETPSGRVLEASGEAHEFTGWPGLTAAIDAAVEGAGGQAAAPTAPTRGGT
jgi:hypothetical protein